MEFKKFGLLPNTGNSKVGSNNGGFPLELISSLMQSFGGMSGKTETSTAAPPSTPTPPEPIINDSKAIIEEQKPRYFSRFRSNYEEVKVQTSNDTTKEDVNTSNATPNLPIAKTPEIPESNFENRFPASQIKLSNGNACASFIKAHDKLSRNKVSTNK